MSKTDNNPDNKSRSSKDDSSFVSRWSQRKQNVQESRSGQGKDKVDDRDLRQEQDLPDPDLPLNSIVSDGIGGRMQTRTTADQLAEQRARANTGESDNPLTDQDMPALDTLDEHSDFSGFLSPGVSDKLRKQALRKLFSGAAFNVRDGLDDYDDDFTNFEGLGDIVTSDMKHRQEVEAEKRRQAELAEREGEQPETRVAEQGAEDEEPDNVESGEDSESIDDVEPSVKDDQKSVTLAEDGTGVAGKPTSQKPS